MQFFHAAHCVIFNNFATNIGIGAYFVCYKYMNHDKETAFRYIIIKKK